MVWEMEDSALMTNEISCLNDLYCNENWRVRPNLKSLSLILLKHERNYIAKKKNLSK